MTEATTATFFSDNPEIAVLTLGRDRYIGSKANEVIYGDTDGILEARQQGGHDKIFTRQGRDVVFGDAGELIENAQGGNDRIRLLDGGVVYGDAFAMTDTAYGGDDFIRGGRYSDELFGDARLLLASSHGGNDVLRAGSGDDAIYGDALFLEDTAVGGDDYLYGGKGDDRLYGDAIDIAATAFGGNDYLVGVDLFSIRPGQGELDTLTGNGGSDRFVLGDHKRAFYVGEGIDDHAIITDFSFTDQDIIQLHGTAADYELQNFDLGTVSGVSIFLKGTNEMIGAVLNFTAETLALNSGAFEFVA